MSEWSETLAETATRVTGESAPGVPLPVAAAHRYVVERELGQGGQALVLAARDAVLGREVALKTSLQQGADAAGFLREVRITAQLEHPGIVPVHELGATERGELFCTQKLVRGRTLRAALAAANTLDERLALLPHLVDVCDAVAYAHSRGVVHRDLKPENVMVGEFGETVVLDWGIARVLGSEADEPGARPLAEVGPGQTVAGAIVGTPLYMSPEQARGQAHAVDARSDVWSLGVMLYEVVAGRPPFEAKQLHALLDEVAAGRFTPLQRAAPDAPGELAAVVARCLAREPSARYPDARALAADLRSFRAGGRVSAYRYSAPQLAARWVRRHPVLAVLALTFGAGLGLRFLAQRTALIEARMSEARASEQLLRWDEAAGAWSEVVELSAGYPEARWGRRFTAPLAARPEQRWGPGAVRTEKGEGPRQLAWAAIDDRGERALVWDYRLRALLMRAQGGWKVLRDAPPGGGAIASGAWAFAAGSAWVARGDGEPVELPGTAGARHLALTPDGRWLAVDLGANVLLFDLESGAPPRTLAGAAGGGGAAHALAFSADGAWLAQGGADRSLRWWRTADGARSLLEKTPARATGLVWDLPRDRLYVGGDDGSVSTFAVGAARLERVAAAHRRTVSGLALSPDGRLLASASHDGELALWDAAAGGVVSRTRAGGEELHALAFDPAGDRVEVLDRTGARWSWATAPAHGLVSLTQCADQVQAIAWSPDGAGLAVGCLSGELYFHDGKATRQLRAGGERVAGLSFAANGRQLLVGGSEGRVEALAVGDFGKAARADLASGSFVALAGAADREEAWAATGDGLVRIDAHGREKQRLEKGQHVTAAAASDDGRWLAWRVNGQNTVWLQQTAAPESRREVKLPGYARRLAFRPGRNPGLLVTGDFGAVEVDLERGVPRAIAGVDPDASRIAPAPDGRAALIGTRQGVQLLDLRVGAPKVIGRLAGPHGDVTQVAWSPSGRQVAIGDTSGRTFLRTVGD